MTATGRDIVISIPERTQDEEMQHAIDNFMRALQTYPDRAACEPGLSFEQHFFQIAAEELQLFPQEARVN